jgi:hypothetical protein
MPIAHRLRRSAAALAVAAGAGVFGFAVGGLATVDGDLRAAAPAPPALESRFVVDGPSRAGCDDDRRDRPAADPHATFRKEL